MTRLSMLALVLAAAPLAQAQDAGKKADLPSACEVRAYYLDKDGKPVDASDVKADLLFETKDGKSRTYPMTLTQPKDKAELPAFRHLAIEGSPYRMAVGTVCTHASAPGGTSAYDKPFLKPLPVPVEPEKRGDVDKRDEVLTKAPYFRAYLNEQAIQDLAAVPYTDASIQFTTRNEVRKTKAFTCAAGVPTTACARVGDELKTLEKQIQAKDMTAAKATMARIREQVASIPSTAANEKARKDTEACCKELDSAVQAGNHEKALIEIRKLKESCEKCDECMDPSEKESKPGKKQ